MSKYQIELSLSGELSKQLNELRCYIIHLQCKYTAQQTFEKTESVRTIMPIVQLNLSCWKWRFSLNRKWVIRKKRLSSTGLRKCENGCAFAKMKPQSIITSDLRKS